MIPRAPHRPARRHATGLVRLVLAGLAVLAVVLLGGALAPPDVEAPPTSASDGSVRAVPTTAPTPGPTSTSTPTTGAPDDASPPAVPGPDAAPAEPGTGAQGGTAAGPTSALAVVALLEVRGRAPRTGYDRDLFGRGWVDVDRNGCDTRNDVLARDLRDVTVRAGTQGCVVLSGTLLDPFSGATIAFVRGEGTSEAVQVDHVVALSDAWQKGAQGWDAPTRVAFANDPLNLLAVDGRLNEQKGDGDAATWLPPHRPSWCPYVARQVGVKHTYGLAVTAAERDAMVRVLSTCPDEPLPPGATPPPAAPAPAPAHPAPAPTAAAAPFESCAAARAAGAAPVLVGQPGYGPHLDGDGDGVGCEG